MSELLTIDDMGAQLGMTRDYVRDKIVKRPDFPRPALALSQKHRRWSRADFDRWVKRQAQTQAR